MSNFKNFITKTPFYSARSFLLQKIDSYQQLKQWKKNGKPLPPPQPYKHSVIKAFAKKFGINTFVETGTFYGDTIQACRYLFVKLYSIELNKEFYSRAKNRFKNDKKVKLYQGDSGEMIAEILKEINEPVLFWLDGHYSGSDTAKGDLNTPIVAELTHIFNHHIKNHVILIDDARCFTGVDDYPTIQKLNDFVKQRNPSLSFLVENDMIRIY